MPTPYSAMATVASGLAGIDPNSADAVEKFYAETFPEYSETTRDLIFEWLAATVDDVSPAEVSKLVRAIESGARPEELSPQAHAVEIDAKPDAISDDDEESAPTADGPMYR